MSTFAANHADNMSTMDVMTLSASELEHAMPNAQLRRIAQKVADKQRLSNEQGLYLFEHAPLSALQLLADFKRAQICGCAVLFATTLFVHPTNLCELSCPMCSFYAKPGWKSAWFMTPEDILKQVRTHLHHNLNEIHVVGGLWREANLSYYEAIFKGIQDIDPSLHIKALTPVEYDFLATMHGLSVPEVFKLMKSWGLASLPGGGAEILVEEVRRQIAPQKISSDRYLEIHKLAHEQGLRSNITMLYGHVEDPCHIITHLDRIRQLQDHTGGFRTFVPLKYHLENNALGKRLGRIKPKSAHRVYAIARLMLDNIKHIKVLWNYLGVDEALELLKWGGNDLGSTALDEKIIKMAGGVDIVMSRQGMSHLIQSAGRNPHCCHSGEV